MMDCLQRAVVGPKIEIIGERALRRRVLGHLAPLAPRAQHVHDPIHNFAHIHLALAAPMFGRGNQRPDMPPFFIRRTDTKMSSYFNRVDGFPVNGLILTLFCVTDFGVNQFGKQSKRYCATTGDA